MTSDKQKTDFISSLVTRHCSYSPADEMNDLHAVAFFKRGLRPTRAPDHLVVEFDCKAFGREREMLYEFHQVDTCGHVARLAVDDYEQIQSFLSASHLMNHAPQLRPLTLQRGADENRRAP